MRSRVRNLRKSKVVSPLNLDAKAVTTQSIVDGASPFINLDGRIGWGENDFYPQIMKDIYINSPTMKGVVNVRGEFIKGMGIENGGDIIVNRNNETLNDVFDKAIDDYKWINGFIFHFNFNAFGQIVEIQNMDIRLFRLKRNDDKKKGGEIDRCI